MPYRKPDYSLRRKYSTPFDKSEIAQISKKVGIIFIQHYWVSDENGRLGTIKSARGDKLMVLFEGQTATEKCDPKKLVYYTKLRPERVKKRN